MYQLTPAEIGTTIILDINREAIERLFNPDDLTISPAYDDNLSSSEIANGTNWHSEHLYSIGDIDELANEELDPKDTRKLHGKSPAEIQQFYKFLLAEAGKVNAAYIRFTNFSN